MPKTGCCFSNGRPPIMARGCGAFPEARSVTGTPSKARPPGSFARETSLVCTSLKFLFYQDSPPGEAGKMHCINFYFQARVLGDVVLNEESSAFAWVDRDSLSAYPVVFRNAEGIMRYWKAERQPVPG